MVGQHGLRAALVLTIGLATTAFAEGKPHDRADTFSGLYRPAGAIGESWSCDPGSIGVDGGALAVTGGILEGVETRCALTNPSLNDEGNTDFTAICTAEGETFVEELTLKRSENRLTITRFDGTVEWALCHSTINSAETVLPRDE